MEYCVAIRTLGSAGEKFQKELDSIISQTIKPQGIFVYIPEGYPIPKETVGIEQYIRCRKGMVAQRALPYNEITTPLCLFLDDDVYLPPDAVETMINAMIAHQGDCIVADTFKNQDMNVRSKIKSAITNWALPRRDDNWAFKIGYTATFSYNNHPRRNVYPSQSGAGPCSLWRIEALRQIHFEDELWMDKFGFAYGDDLLYFHKLFRNGGKLLTLYHSGIEHMDAQSSRKSYDNSRKFYIRAKTGMYYGGELRLMRPMSLLCIIFWPMSFNSLE